MSDLKKYRVTGPCGIDIHVDAESEEWALFHVHQNFSVRVPSAPDIMRQAGYRAEPIEEPNMVTVRAEDLALAIAAMICHDNEGISNGDQYKRLRAALDGAK